MSGSRYRQSKSERLIITQYWFRLFVSTVFSMDNIAKIVIEFGNEYEEFDIRVSHQYLVFDDESNSISITEADIEDPDADIEVVSGFGKIDAISGHKYHWKLQLLEESKIKVGIVEADKLKQYPGFFNENHHWWLRSWGYAYYYKSYILHDTMKKKYGEQLERGDVIEMWLDLEKNYDLSYVVNDTEYGKAFDVDKDKTYRLAIGFVEGKVSLISFELN